MTWTSARADRLPADWKTRRAKVKARAHGRCQAAVHAPKCNGVGAECDHIVAGDDHSLANLQWLSRECHAAKTKVESAAARARIPKAKRPPEPHPGLR